MFCLTWEASIMSFPARTHVDGDRLVIGDGKTWTRVLERCVDGRRHVQRSSKTRSK